jgi:hypothetical protein
MPSSSGCIETSRRAMTRRGFDQPLARYSKLAYVRSFSSLLKAWCTLRRSAVLVTRASRAALPASPKM